MTVIISTDTDATQELFASPAALRTGFERGLGGLLQHDLLGVFILVLANTSFERSAFARLRYPLALAYRRWCERFDRDDGRALASAPDDVTVFKALRRVGFERLSVTRARCLDGWELQFNQLRALRPPRISDAVPTRLHRPFDPQGFHFNKPFLRKEVLWEGELAGAPVRLLYNKFPFAEMHGLLVPWPDANRPQFLERAAHELVSEICRDLGARLPGIGLGYNAYGAYASVNHLHFQTFMRSSGAYPIEAAHWRHNGGDRVYPLPVQRHTDPDSAWSALNVLHKVGVSYNLLYRPGAVYIVPRAMQGSYQHSAWSGGFAWSEVAGALTVSSAADFERLTGGQVEAELMRLAVRP